MQIHWNVIHPERIQIFMLACIIQDVPTRRGHHMEIILSFWPLMSLRTAAFPVGLLVGPDYGQRLTWTHHSQHHDDNASGHRRPLADMPHCFTEVRWDLVVCQCQVRIGCTATAIAGDHEPIRPAAVGSWAEIMRCEGNPPRLITMSTAWQRGPSLPCFIVPLFRCAGLLTGHVHLLSSE